MFKDFLILSTVFFLLFSCSKKEEVKIASKENNEEKVLYIYNEAIDALKVGDAFFAKKKFKEAESLFEQREWAAKASIMASYADYSRNAFGDSVFALETHIKNYPEDENLSYAHYLIAICYFEQILDEKKDLKPLIKAKEKFEFIILNFPNTDYATDASYKIDLIIDQMAAKEMSIARFYMKTEKWIPALNRLKFIVKEYERTVFIEEALHRLVEVYYRIGLVEESKQAASILGYNYQSSQWYKRSYKVFNKEYKIKKLEEGKELGLIRRKLKSLIK